MVALVGAGGKTTTAWRLLEELMDAGESTIFTTTTQVFRPTGEVTLILDGEPTPSEISKKVGNGRPTVVAAGTGGEGDPEQVAHSRYPASPVKLVGLTPEVLNRLAKKLPSITWLVEADGARGLLVKAPAAHEPVIPSRVDRVIVLGCLDVVGKRLSAETVHRPEIVGQLLGVEPGGRVTTRMLADVLQHPSGGLKGIPPRAESVVALTQWEKPASAAGAAVANELMRVGRVDRVVQLDLDSVDPVVAVWAGPPRVHPSS
jgi:molybdenum cofactor cytidylyltransferase